MSIVLDGTAGITSPGGDTATVSVATPIVKSPSSLTLQTNGSTTAATIDTSGGVGINTTTPSATYSASLAVKSPATVAALALDSAATYSTAVNWYNNGTIRWAMQTLPTNEFRWYDYTAGTERLRINNTGNIILSGGTTSATGIGVTFPSTQSVSSDANCLDDYEEGTFSPTIQGWSGTYSVQKGYYTKIGNMVTVIGQVIINANTGSFAGNPGPANFPFTAGSRPGSYVNGTWAAFDGVQGLPSGWLSAGPLDGPMNGNTSPFPNVFVANGTCSNWSSSQCNSAQPYQVRFQTVYFTA